MDLLVVDDDTLLVGMLRYHLTGMGWKVTTADSCFAANEAFAKAPNAFNLFVVDSLLPDGDGVSLAKKLLQQNHRARAVIFSGLCNLRCDEPRIKVFQKGTDTSALLDLLAKSYQSGLVNAPEAFSI